METLNVNANLSTRPLDYETGGEWLTMTMWAMLCTVLFKALAHPVASSAKLTLNQRTVFAQKMVAALDCFVVGTSAIYYFCQLSDDMVESTSRAVDLLSAMYVGFCIYDIAVRSAHGFLWDGAYIIHHLMVFVVYIPTVTMHNMGWARALGLFLLFGDGLTSLRACFSLLLAVGIDFQRARKSLYYLEFAWFFVRLSICFFIDYKFFTTGASEKLANDFPPWMWWAFVGNFQAFIGLLIYWLNCKTVNFLNRRAKAKAQ